VSEGIEMLAEGIAPAIIDNVGAATGMPRGPLELSDDVALDLAYKVRSQTAKDLGVSLDRVNVNGGAIAMGHPLGATGAMILGILIDELHRRGLRYGLGTGAAIAGYTLVDGYAVKHLLVPPLLVVFMSDTCRTLLLLPLLLRDRAATRALFRQQWRHALAVALLGPAAYILVLTAVQMAPLSHVAPAREISMLFAALLGGRLLGEGHRGARLAGAACMVAGVIALAIG
jgi:drug/metabolite transporter (DMT)-like permease